MPKPVEMLWQDHSTKKTIEQRIAEAAAYFEKKYGLTPDYVVLPAHDATGMNTQIALAGRPLPHGEILVRSANLPIGHLIIGHEL